MSQVRLGKTEIITDKNGFGALPIQRISFDEADALIMHAYENGVTFFDTARFYTDSEEKLGRTLCGRGLRDQIYLASKTMAANADAFRSDLETTLTNLRTDHLDLYQFHNPAFCPKPGDGTGLYEAMEEAKAQGKIRHIGITNHRVPVAKEPSKAVSMRHFSSRSAIFPQRPTWNWQPSAKKQTWALSP